MAVFVVLAESHLLIRERMHALVAAASDLVLQAECGDGLELWRVMGQRAPNVIVIDDRLPAGPKGDAIRFAHHLRCCHSQVGIVLISNAHNPEYAADLFSSGSKGRAYLLKERLAEPGLLVQTIRRVASGGSFTDPAIGGIPTWTERRPAIRSVHNCDPLRGSREMDVR